MQNEQTIPEAAAVDKAADEQAIRDIVAALQSSWNHGDAAGWSAHLTQGAVHTVWDGRVVTGWDNITTGHEYLFRNAYKGTRITFTVRWVRFLRPDVAAVQFDGELGGRDDIPMSRIRPLAVLTKQDGRWLIEIFQNTPILPYPFAAESENSRS